MYIYIFFFHVILRDHECYSLAKAAYANKGSLMLICKIISNRTTTLVNQQEGRMKREYIKSQ
jgi:hypothetical protein